MLSLEERLLIENFVEDFPSEDLYALALTISKSNLLPVSRQDALNIICQHSERIETILEKKRIKKSYICDFLHKNNVSITLSWDKPALIRKVVEFRDRFRNQAKIYEFSNTPSTSQSNENTFCVPNGINATNYFEEFSYKFSEWFYSLLNDGDPSKLGPEHFFDNSEVKLAMTNENNTDFVEASTSSDVARAFHDLHSKYGLKFLPNLTPNAVKYQNDIHGQVMLCVNGTLHARNTCQIVGVFEQIFLLIRDINDNENWKIRNTQVILRSSNVALEAPQSSNNLHSICPSDS